MKKLWACLLIVLLVLPISALSEAYGWNDGSYIFGDVGITLAIPNGMAATDPGANNILRATGVNANNEFNTLSVNKIDETDIELLKQDFVDQNYTSLKALFLKDQAASASEEQEAPVVSGGTLLTAEQIYLKTNSPYFLFFSNEIDYGNKSIPYIAYFLSPGHSTKAEACTYSIAYFINDGEKIYIIQSLINLSGKEAASHKQLLISESKKNANQQEPIHHNFVVDFAKSIFIVDLTTRLGNTGFSYVVPSDFFPENRSYNLSEDRHADDSSVIFETGFFYAEGGYRYLTIRQILGGFETVSADAQANAEPLPDTFIAQVEKNQSANYSRDQVIIVNGAAIPYTVKLSYDHMDESPFFIYEVTFSLTDESARYMTTYTFGAFYDDYDDFRKMIIEHQSEPILYQYTENIIESILCYE